MANSRAFGVLSREFLDTLKEPKVLHYVLEDKIYWDKHVRERHEQFRWWKLNLLVKKFSELLEYKNKIKNKFVMPRKCLMKQEKNPIINTINVIIKVTLNSIVFFIYEIEVWGEKES